MKAFIALIIALAVGIVTTYAQCDKKSVLTSNKTEFLAADSSVEREMTELVTAEFNRDTISILISGEREQLMRGAVKEFNCNWKTPYKDGKTTLKADLTDGSGDARTLSITIEGKAGKTSFIAVMEDGSGRKVRLNVDKFEEKK